MKAAFLNKIHSPWHIQECPIPKPKAGQVLIKVKTAGMCGTDVHIQKGMIPIPLPIVGGHETIGEIIELGEGVDQFKIGDRVGVSWNQKGCDRCLYCLKNKIRFCETSTYPKTWITTGGGFAEFMVAWAAGCLPIPSTLSNVEATPFFCAGFTVASGFLNAKPKPGDRIAVLGLGGLGHLAIQYAKAKGFAVIALTKEKNKLSLAKQLGADDAIVFHDSCGKALAEIGGVDVLLYTGSNSKEASEALYGLKPEGRFVSMGFDTTAMQILPANLIEQEIQIIGSGQGNKGDLQDILQLAAKGKIKPLIEVFSFEKINEAFSLLEKGQIRFRVVLKIND